MKAIVLSRSSDTAEIKSLLDTLRIDVVKEFIQKKEPHPTSYLGPGKVEEIAGEVALIDPEMVVVNDHLKPSQHHFLEMKFQKECVDRIGVILRIFAEHANTPEAIAQVQLARLRYEQPFLREWIHKAKSGERPGFLAGGAYATDVYYEHARSHIKRIERRLEDLSRVRDVKRSRRHEQGFTLVSLAGYTNAGKSALMNALCSSEIEVSPQLFSSLSTTTRRVTGVKGLALMIDTVGFIRDLPPDLVDAFKSTLEEIFFSDLVLLTFDASEQDDMISSKLRTSVGILTPKVENSRLLLVGTKTDRISKERTSEVKKAVQEMFGASEVLMVSSVAGEGLDAVRERISDAQGRTYHMTVMMPLTDASLSLVSRLHATADVDQSVQDGQLRVVLTCNPSDADKVRSWVLAAGAKVAKGGPRRPTRSTAAPLEVEGGP